MSGNNNNNVPPPSETQNTAKPPRPHRLSSVLHPRQSAIGLRRLATNRDNGDQTNNGGVPPQKVRSMLDVDGDSADRGSIKLRRLGTSTKVPRTAAGPPQNPQNVRSMLDVEDNTDRDTQAADFAQTQTESQVPAPGNKERLGRFGRMRILGRKPKAGAGGRDQLIVQDEYDPSVVDMLDVVDPEVSTLNSITNVQNSLFIPSMGRFINRRPTYNLSSMPRMPGAFPQHSRENIRAETPDYLSAAPMAESAEPSEAGTPGTEAPPAGRPSVERIPSTMTERFYAVRPHHVSLADWSDEDIAELNDHVRHMLHSKRSAFGRSMKAFGQYVRKPLGFFVTLYATLITLFGLAWVLFLIGWINVGGKQLYVINVIDNVLVALFAIMGDGLIPWRIVDTYHMCFIARYHHLTWKLRNKMKVPDLKDKNDLPSEPVVSGPDEQRDLEAARDIHFKEQEEYSVLTPEQQKKLEHHQNKFAKSHTFYKPHETETHHAFPLRLLVAIVVLLDCHSCFQISLGLCTWLIDYRTRPGALTAVILCCSIAVNTTAGILITIGDRRTRKKDVVERMFRQELTEEAMRRMEQEKEKEAREREKAENQLHDIEEEDGIWPLPKPKLDFLHRNSEDNKSKPRRSGEMSRKSTEQAGRFDTSVDSRVGRSSTERRIAGAFPEAD